ncbi:MAG TPA: TA system VapC family ribonuclease toxin [Conexibacter sp.]
MIALDSNLLIYAHRRDTEAYAAARAQLEELAAGRALWAIPYPCVHEFIRNVTEPRIYADPTPLDLALEQVMTWQRAPRARLISEGSRHLELLAQVSKEGRVRGAAIHDARIAAICLEHGVSELWTADRDFGRFPALKTRNPLVG